LKGKYLGPDYEHATPNSKDSSKEYRNYLLYENGKYIDEELLGKARDMVN